MNDRYHYIPDLNSLVSQIPEDSIVSRTIYSDERLKVVLFAFAAGQELSEHTSAYPAALHVLSGTASLTLGADAMTATAGTWVHMAARLPHSVVAETEVQMLLLMFP